MISVARGVTRPSNGGVMAQLLGAVQELWRFPVKSMRGERLDEADVTAGGLLGDRAYALIDVSTGKVVSAKSAKLFPAVLECAPAFVEPPRAGAPIPAVRITLPNGKSVGSGAGDAHVILSEFFGRDVRLA